MWAQKRLYGIERGDVIVVMMGPCGCGKTTVGQLVAERLGARFIEGDEFHPESNRAKMAAGAPLGDADRWPWLDRIAEACAETISGGRAAVVACSALKRSYRARLSTDGIPALFVLLDGERDLFHARLEARPDHFMPSALLDSQLAALEKPEADEEAIVVNVDQPPAELADQVVRAIRDRETDARS